jgi:hypothetical protein
MTQQPHFLPVASAENLARLVEAERARSWPARIEVPTDSGRHAVLVGPEMARAISRQARAVGV